MKGEGGGGRGPRRGAPDRQGGDEIDGGVLGAPVDVGALGILLCQKGNGSRAFLDNPGRGRESSIRLKKARKLSFPFEPS